MSPPVCATAGCWRSASPGLDRCGDCHRKAVREERRARAEEAQEQMARDQLGLFQ